MKKIVILIILVSLCVSGCQTHKTEPDSTANEVSNYACIQLGPRYNNIDEYTEFISTPCDWLPNDFVPYEKLDILGSFYSLIFSSNRTNTQIFKYMYNFTDSNGFKYSLYVTHGDEADTPNYPIYDIGGEMKSMIDVPADERCVIIRNEKYYVYVSTGLVSIQWRENNIYFDLAVCNYDKSPDYPMDGETTFLSRIFSLDDEISGAAFAELSASLNS